MNSDSDASERKAKRGFRRRKILTLGEVAELIERSVHTARRRLKQWRAHTSYNHNGRYYSLPEVPTFDANGLWHCRGVFFSQHGNLKQTLIELIHRSEAGLDAGELRTLLGLDPRSFLSAFADHPQLSREKVQGRFVYYSAVPSVYAQQHMRRSGFSATAREPTAIEAVAILVEKIKHPTLGQQALSRRLRKQQIFVEAQSIENLFVRHDLAVKKTPPST